MIRYFKDQKIKDLLLDICNEHLAVSRGEDSNMGYLWHMYAHGTKKGDFRPFILISEMNLLVKTGYLTEDERKNLTTMLNSNDDDNAHLTGYSILTLRAKRIEELGLWTPDNEKYKGINYTRDIINPEMFLSKKT